MRLTAVHGRRGRSNTGDSVVGSDTRFLFLVHVEPHSRIRARLCFTVMLILWRDAPLAQTVR